MDCKAQNSYNLAPRREQAANPGPVRGQLRGDWFWSRAEHESARLAVSQPLRKHSLVPGAELSQINALKLRHSIRFKI